MADIVKASINVKEGTILLEGPQMFVEKYLNKYDTFIAHTKTVIPNSSKEEKIEFEEDKPKRTRIVRPRSGPKCGEKIRELVDEGFFKDPRTSSDVKNRLQEKGWRYDISLVSATLNNIFKSGKLERTGVGKEAKYYSNLQ